MSFILPFFVLFWGEGVGGGEGGVAVGKLSNSF